MAVGVDDEEAEAAADGRGWSGTTGITGACERPDPPDCAALGMVECCIVWRDITGALFLSSVCMVMPTCGPVIN